MMSSQLLVASSLGQGKKVLRELEERQTDQEDVTAEPRCEATIQTTTKTGMTSLNPFLKTFCKLSKNGNQWARDGRSRNYLELWPSQWLNSWKSRCMRWQARSFTLCWWMRMSKISIYTIHYRLAQSSRRLPNSSNPPPLLARARL